MAVRRADVRNEVAVREARPLGHPCAAGGELKHAAERHVAGCSGRSPEKSTMRASSDEIFAGDERPPSLLNMSVSTAAKARSLI